MKKTLSSFDFLQSSHEWSQTILSCGWHGASWSVGSIPRFGFCVRPWSFQIDFGRISCTFGSHTFVPISWMCTEQTSVSHGSTESEVISSDARLRMDGIPAQDLLDLVIGVLHSCTTSNKHREIDVAKVSIVKYRRIEWAMKPKAPAPTPKRDRHSNRTVVALSLVDHVVTSANSSHFEVFTFLRQRDSDQDYHWRPKPDDDTRVPEKAESRLIRCWQNPFGLPKSKSNMLTKPIRRHVWPKVISPVMSGITFLACLTSWISRCFIVAIFFQVKIPKTMSKGSMQERNKGEEFVLAKSNPVSLVSYRVSVNQSPVMDWGASKSRGNSWMPSWNSDVTGPERKRSIKFLKCGIRGDFSAKIGEVSNKRRNTRWCRSPQSFLVNRRRFHFSSSRRTSSSVPVRKKKYFQLMWPERRTQIWMRCKKAVLTFFFFFGTSLWIAVCQMNQRASTRKRKCEVQNQFAEVKLNHHNLEISNTRHIEKVFANVRQTMNSPEDDQKVLDQKVNVLIWGFMYVNINESCDPSLLFQQWEFIVENRSIVKCWEIERAMKPKAPTPRPNRKDIITEKPMNCQMLVTLSQAQNLRNSNLGFLFFCGRWSCDQNDHKGHKCCDETRVPNPQSCVGLVGWHKSVWTPKSKSNMLTPKNFSQTCWPKVISPVMSGIIFSICHLGENYKANLFSSSAQYVVRHHAETDLEPEARDRARFHDWMAICSRDEICFASWQSNQVGDSKRTRLLRFRKIIWERCIDFQRWWTSQWIQRNILNRRRTIWVRVEYFPTTHCSGNSPRDSDQKITFSGDVSNTEFSKDQFCK